jgi:hypothetical protein
MRVCFFLRAFVMEFHATCGMACVLPLNLHLRPCGGCVCVVCARRAYVCGKLVGAGTLAPPSARSGAGLAASIGRTFLSNEIFSNPKTESAPPRPKRAPGGVTGSGSRGVLGSRASRERERPRMNGQRETRDRPRTEYAVRLRSVARSRTENRHGPFPRRSAVGYTKIGTRASPNRTTQNHRPYYTPYSAFFA